MFSSAGLTVEKNEQGVKDLDPFSDLSVSPLILFCFLVAACGQYEGNTGSTVGSTELLLLQNHTLPGQQQIGGSNATLYLK